MENNEKQLPYEPTAQNLQEAMEQLRAAYTCGRIAFTNLAVLMSLDNKTASWAKATNKKVRDYFELLINGYKDFERLYQAKIEDDGKTIADGIGDNPVPNKG